MPRYIYFNGAILPADEKLVSAANRGLRYGDGIFETIRVAKGKIPLVPYHLERLQHGMRMLEMEIPNNLAAAKNDANATPPQTIDASTISNTTNLENSILALCQKNNVADTARVRINVFRGNTHEEIQLIIEAEPLDPGYDHFNTTGLEIGIYSDSKKSCDPLANLKSNNRLHYLMASRHAQKHGLNDCLLLNNFERICDSTIANIFWVKGKQIYTPPLSEGCVAGVMRHYLIEKMRAAGYAVEEQICTKQKLSEADEIFLTNALWGTRWVAKLREKNFVNKISSQLYNQFIKSLFFL